MLLGCCLYVQAFPEPREVRSFYCDLFYKRGKCSLSKLKEKGKNVKSSIDCFLACDLFISLYVISGHCVASGHFKCESLLQQEH